MKIWQKLAIGFGGTSFLLGTIAILSIKIDSEVKSATNETIHGMVKEAKAASDIFTSVQNIQQLNQGFLLEKLISPEENHSFADYQSEVKLELEQLEKNIIASQQASINQKLIIQSSNEISLDYKETKIEGEREEIVRMTKLLNEIQNYQRDWQFFLEKTDRNSEEVSLYLIRKLTKRMNQVIFPLVKEYYEDSLSEITESELATQELTSKNITIIKNYVLFTLILTSLLFLYIYRSIYTPIRYLKLATFRLGLNPLEYQPINPKNPGDELGELINFFNRTIEGLKTKIISKSYLDNIINSIDRSLIVIDNRNKIEKVNQNTIKLLGYSELELIGQSIDRILAPGNSLTIDELIKLDNLSSRCFTIELITKKSEKISLSVYFSFLFDSEGNKKGTICLGIPINNLSLSDIINLQKTKENAKKNVN